MARRAYVFTPARRAALKRAQARSAAKRKGRTIKEYVDDQGKKTGLATNKTSKTNRSALRKVRKAGKHNVRHANKLSKLDKKIAKSKSRSRKRKSLATRLDNNTARRRAFMTAAAKTYPAKKKRR